MRLLPIGAYNLVVCHFIIRGAINLKLSMLILQIKLKLDCILYELCMQCSYTLSFIYFRIGHLKKNNDIHFKVNINFLSFKVIPTEVMCSNYINKKTIEHGKHYRLHV